jgi:COP9 signalosome complex subunit 4
MEVLPLSLLRHCPRAAPPLPPAQVLDAKRKFIEAALRYLDVMRSVEAAEVDEAELIAFVEKAAICAVLAPAGPQRQRVMGTLMRLEKIALVQVRACTRSHGRCGVPVAAW